MEEFIRRSNKPSRSRAVCLLPIRIFRIFRFEPKKAAKFAKHSSRHPAANWSALTILRSNCASWRICQPISAWLRPLRTMRTFTVRQRRKYSERKGTRSHRMTAVLPKWLTSVWCTAWVRSVWQRTSASEETRLRITSTNSLLVFRAFMTTWKGQEL